MIKVLHEDGLWVFSIDLDNQFVRTDWKGEMLSSQDFEEKTWIIAKFVEEHKPKAFLANAKKFNYTISPDEQSWHNAILFPIFTSINLQKMAVVMPEDLFTEVSVAQAYDENADGFITKYFENEHDAIKWIA